MPESSTPRDVSSNFKNLPTAPIAHKEPDDDTRHGITRCDNYAWMRAKNWQEVLSNPASLDPKIRRHLEEENAYTQAAMADTSELQRNLFSEMLDRIKRDSPVPMKNGPFAYGKYYLENAEHPRYFRIPRDGAMGDSMIRHILLDGDEEAEGKAYFRIVSFQCSSDHTRGLWGYDDNASEHFTLRVRNLSTGEDLDDVITNTNGDGTWAPDGQSFFYANHLTSKIYHHVIGNPQAEDRLIYEAANPSFFVSVNGSLLHDFIYIDTHDQETTECRIISTKELAAVPKLVAPGVTGIQYWLTEGSNVFFVLTNADGAEDFKIMEAPVDAPHYENWRELVPHRPGTHIIRHIAFSRHLVWQQRRNGLPEIAVLDRLTHEEHTIAFTEEAYSLALTDNSEYDTDVIRFTYSSMRTPKQLFDYNMHTRKRTLLSTQDLPSGYVPEDYTTRRVFAPTTPDGPEVPITLLYHKDTSLDGSAPCLLLGYGAYGITISANFGTNRLSLINRGFIFAIAHVRGGKDKGFQWYEDGKMEKKPNTFNDFIAAADYLHDKRFTSYANIVAQGHSAGGTLMGAIANLAPEKFNAIIATQPFVDVLNTLLDDKLPLTPPDWTQLGNPIESEKFYTIIASYSPYDNVGARPYPAILAVGSLNDPRVTYWEPAKWVAMLREKTTGSKPILLKTHMAAAGHTGPSGRSQQLSEDAFIYAFAIKSAGKT